MILPKLTYSIANLSGIGYKSEKLFHNLGIYSIRDILEFFPRSFSDRTKLCSLQEATDQKSATVKLEVIEHRMIGKRYKQFLKVLVHDGQNYGALLCFNRDFLKNVLTIGDTFYITGKFSYSYAEIQSSSFEIEKAQQNGEYKGKIVPIYHLTSNLAQSTVRKAVTSALSKYWYDLEDELPINIINKRGLLHKKEALKNIHAPKDFNIFMQAKQTFIYEEFFFQNLFLLKRKESLLKVTKEREKISFEFKKHFLQNLPFTLTDYQQRAISEIEEDIFTNFVFSRLLQADVGAGKTVVAIVTMLDVVESGMQAAIMAPTEVLATQHYKTMQKYLSKMNIDILLLTGSTKKKEREIILKKIKSGESRLIVGTHSLFSNEVEYSNLGYVVIDEQQRFGVEQRYQLSQKGNSVDLLLMTATPIPRSLAMSLYGDLKLTLMQGTIDGRKPVKTWLVDNNEERLKKMYGWIRESLKDDGRAIFVYSLIDESQKSDKKNLIQEFDLLSKEFGDLKVGLLHSKIPQDEKNKIVEDFRSGEIKILAATTVVEVGLDISDANIIVVEDTDSYGLSTLHQLRGRVGRNNKQGYMILIADLDNLTEIGRKRLELMTKEHDGFKIAEEDLLIRGPGNFLGTKQSGLPDYKFGDLQKDMNLLLQATEDAKILLKEDSELKMTKHNNTRQSFLERLKDFNKQIERTEV